jgi:hypothetical protein
MILILRAASSDDDFSMMSARICLKKAMLFGGSPSLNAHIDRTNRGIF